jgi:hypothetical protein
MKKIALSLCALLALAACQDKTESVVSPQPPAPGTEGSLVAAGFARMVLQGREDSVNALVVQCDSTSRSQGARVKVGGKELPTKDGKFLLPIPELDDFCGAQIVFTITTTKGTFTDTLRIKGHACDDTTSHHVPVPPVDSSIVFDFQDTGRTIHDRSKTHAASTANAVWSRDAAGTFFLEASATSDANFGALIPDGAKEGSVEIHFRPSETFSSIPARTIFGDDGARIHIGWVDGQLFFQKNHDNIHRFVSSDTGKLRDGNWHRILATWGPQGMTLSLDDTLVAWSNDVSAYHAGPEYSPFGNDLKLGAKTWCCMEPMRISSGLTGSGSYRFLKIGFRQPRIWSDGLPRACEERSHTKVPSCGLTSPAYVEFPIW